MSSDNNPAETPAPQHQGAQASPAQHPSQDGNPNILSALSEMESQFARLRTLHEESMRREAALAEQSRKLTQQQAELDKAREALDQRERQLREQGESIARQRAALDEEKQRLDHEHREAKQRLAAEQEEAEKALAEQMQQQEAKLAKERDATQQSLVQERERLKQEHDKARQELAERQKGEQQRLEDERRGLAERMRAIEEQSASLSQQAAEASRREHAVKEEEERVAAERAKLNREASQFDEKSRQVSESAEQQVTRLNQSWAAKLRSLEDRLHEQESQRTALQQELDVARDQANQLAEMVEQLRADGGGVDPQALAHAESEMNQALQMASEQAEAAQQAAQAAEAARAEAKRAGEAAAAAEQATAAELSKREQAITTLKDRLEKVLQEKSTLLERVRGAEEAAAKAKSEAASAVAAAEKAAREGGGAGGGGGASDATIVGVSATSVADEALMNEFHHPGWTKRRRERLRLYKGLLQTQARKIMQAQAALQKRHEEAEQVLAHRAKLAALSKKLSKQEKRLNSSKAKATTLAAAMYLSVTVAVLGGMAWAVTQHIHPATYLARATLEVDPQIDAGEFELSQWQNFHEELARDSRFIDAAANRMDRRGLKELAVPAALDARLKDDLYVQSTGDGNITLELRGVGAERTALELDTLVAAYKSVSDAARGTRGDDLPTVVTAPAKADTTPIADDRLQWAAGMLGGGGLAVGLLGLLVWSRLVKSKQRMEQMVEIEEALADIDWPEAMGGPKP